MEITVRECQYDEVTRFRKLEGEYHYMGVSHGVGRCPAVFPGTGRESLLGTLPRERSAQAQQVGKRRLHSYALRHGHGGGGERPQRSSCFCEAACQQATQGTRMFEKRKISSANLSKENTFLPGFQGRGAKGTVRASDRTARRCDENLMSAMMVARSFGMWCCARYVNQHPGRTTADAMRYLYGRPSELLRIVLKEGLI